MKKFTRLFIDNIGDADLADSGAVLAYNILFSLFPFIIVLLNILGYFFTGYQDQLSQLLEFFPDQVAQVLASFVNDLSTSSSGSLFSISLLVAIWSSSRGMKTLIQQINKAFGYEAELNPVKTRVLAILMSLVLIIIIMAMLISGPLSSILEQVLESLLGQHSWVDLGFKLLIRLIPYFFIILALFLIYKLSLVGKNIGLRDLAPAPLFSTLVLFILTLAFTFYIDNFASYSATYGSIAGVIVLLLWLYMSSIVFMLGAYLAASIKEYRASKPK